MRAFLTSVMLLGLTLAATGAQAGPTSTLVWGRDGYSMQPACVTDNNYEMAGSDNDTMFLPGDGCAATWNLSSYGFGATDNLVVSRLEYKVTGHVGTICGYFSVTGRWNGQTQPTCSGQDESVIAMTEEGTAGPGDLVTVTWHPTTWAHDNAYLCWIQVLGDPPSGDAGDHAEPACQSYMHPCTSGLTAVTNEDGTVTLTWPDVPGSTNYQVAVREIDPTMGDWFPITPQVPPSTNTYTWSHGEPGRSYQLAVSALEGGSNVTVTYCSAYATIPAGHAEVPFFPTAWSLVGGLAVGGLLTVVILRRR